jgi:DNA-binding XRE family transcriptional regulator
LLASRRRIEAALHAMRVEVRATVAHDLGISQNYVPAIEAGARKPGPKLQQTMLKYFGVRFEDLFEVVLVNPETGQEQVLERR